MALSIDLAWIGVGILAVEISDGESILKTQKIQISREMWFLEVIREDLSKDMRINPISKGDPCHVMRAEGDPRPRRTWCFRDPKGGEWDWSRQKRTSNIKDSLKGTNGQMVQDLLGPCTGLDYPVNLKPVNNL